MGRKYSGNRVIGPWEDARGWTYTIIVAGKHKRVRCRAGVSEADARAEVEDAKRGIWTPPELTVKEAVSLWVDLVWRRTDNRSTAESERYGLAPLIKVCGDLPVYNLTAKHVLRYLTALEGPKKKPRSLATQRGYWLGFTRFSKWLKKKGHCPRDAAVDALEMLEAQDKVLPWREKSAAKRMSRGKPQLRNLTEVQAYLGSALGLETPLYRAATTLPLLTGVSSGELRHLRVGNVDFAAGVIWIRDDEQDGDSWEVKTANRRRSIELPEVIRNDLAELADGREPADFLFAQTRGEHKGQPRDRTWLNNLVKKVCVKADVRVTCPHGLRGTFASVRRVLAERAAASLGEADILRQIGDQLGHGDHGKTAGRHYVGAPARIPALRVLVGGLDDVPATGTDGDFAHNSAHTRNSGVENRGMKAAKG